MAPKRSACLIFNPVAGHGDPDRDLTLIQELLLPVIDLDIQLTTPEVGANKLAKNALEKGVEAIIASGGDGTLNAVAEALLGTPIPLGIISRGTANAFANALSIPDTIEAACQTILEGETRIVDAATCNGDRPMILLAGIGFEAEAVKLADREQKSNLGVLAYILAGFKELRKMQSFEAQLETPNETIKVTAVAVTVANAAPPTSILAQGPAGIIVDDGFLDITVVAPQSKAEALAASFHLLKSALTGNASIRDDIGYFRAKSVKVTTNPPQKVVLDGELMGTTPIEIECRPKALTLYVPKTKQEAPVEKLSGLQDLRVEPKPTAQL